MKNETTYRAAELLASNVKRLRAVALTIPENGVTLSGKNGSGKSSILDSIAQALDGGSAQPERPINDAEDHADIRLTLEAEDGGTPQTIVIERTYERDAENGDLYTTALRVRYDDSTIKRPQSALDALRGATVDPRAWADPPGLTKPAARDRARLKLLCGALKDGFDLDAHAREREILADRRLNAGRDKRAKEAVRDDLGGLPPLPDAPDAEAKKSAEDRLSGARASVSDWKLRERERADRTDSAESAVRAASDLVDEWLEEFNGAKGEVEQLEKDLFKAQTRVGLAREGGRKAQDQHSARKSTLVAVLSETVDQSDADPQPDPEREVIEAEATLAAFDVARGLFADAESARERVRRAHSEFEEAEGLWRDLDDAVGEMDEKLTRAVAALPMPADVEITPELRVLVGGVPVDQASAAERLRAAVGVAAGLCGHLRLLWVHDGALLDAESRAALARAAGEAGVQLILETVEPSDGSVVIEDGEIVGAPGAERRTA